MFRTSAQVAAAAAAALVLSSPAHAASATGSATVRILQAILITKNSDLNFGKVIAGPSPATVSVAESGARTCSGAITCYGESTAAAFAVVGTDGETVTVSLASRQITLNGGGNNSMTLLLRSSTNTLLLTDGKASFRLAGALVVGANQAAGTYTGQFEVAVNYQ